MKARLRYLTCALFISVLLANLRNASAFSPTHLLSTYDLHTGRGSACPQSLSYDAITTDGLLLPASSMKAGDHVCAGSGGKRIEPGSSLQSHGLNLPSLVANPDVSFYAGVETDTRVCGPWAFNASTISWFIINNRNEEIVDDQTKITLQPGYVYVTYSHFSDLCVYRRNIGQLPKLDNNPEPPTTVVVPVATPEIEASVEPEDDSSSACFPGDAIVDVEGRGSIRMRELKLGDRVLSSEKGTYSEVFAFSHRDAHAYSSFVVIHTSGGKSLSLSPGHLLYLDGVPKTAKDARDQHSITTASGASEQIVSIEHQYERGLFNPHTLSGTIIVNNILATTWTSALSPVVATSLLSPLRLLYKLFPLRITTVSSGPIDIIIDQIRGCTQGLRRFPGFPKWSTKQFTNIPLR